jgi:hypothetical protein
MASNAEGHTEPRHSTTTVVYFFLAAQAPHFALQAPHLPLQAPQACADAPAPHFLAPHIIAQPPRAAAVTTAEANVRASVDESEFMVVLLGNDVEETYFLAPHAPHLALQAPHLALALTFL